MKFKYYLRGLGLGIIFTSIVFMVSYRFNGEELTDAQIIQKARSLGMTMEKDTSFEEETESVNKPQTVLDAQSDHKEQSTKKEDSEISNEKKSLQERFPIIHMRWKESRHARIVPTGEPAALIKGLDSKMYESWKSTLRMWRLSRLLRQIMPKRMCDSYGCEIYSKSAGCH